MALYDEFSFIKIVNRSLDFSNLTDAQVFRASQVAVLLFVVLAQRKAAPRQQIVIAKVPYYFGYGTNGQT
jgi:hypothetical protein